jgi:hypothetical protein
MKGIQIFFKSPIFVSMETAAKFVQLIPIFLAYLVPLDVHVVPIKLVCSSFEGFENIQNGARCHGNQGTKWPPNTKILRFGRNLVSR